ncbi:MAG TPA: HEAT repeat domain-containing protein [Candidatus Sulfotelmatobacter sp.]|nr:HEAT repeat domain-containing protein [Candidatus Sulfotelmatobacter sp.]
MGGFKPPFSGTGGEGTPPLDPRLQPTPDYGTLGPGSDIANYSGQPVQYAPRKRTSPLVSLIAMAIGLATALFPLYFGTSHKPHRASPQSQTNLQEAVSARDLQQLDQMDPQNQAETLLKMAMAHSDGAVEQISARADGWNGQVQWNPQIANLSAAALNSNDLRVRESGVEVELAAYGLAKNSESLDYVLKTVESSDHSQKIWALWALGLMGNQGVGQERVLAVLTDHLKDSDADSRRWAVEALALMGSDATIAPLLQTMHDDPSPLVRERAACGVASSGLFTQEQRDRAIPTLLNYTEDPSLDAQTHAWAFQALGDITHQRLPNDPAAWRGWYHKQAASE